VSLDALGSAISLDPYHWIKISVIDTGSELCVYHRFSKTIFFFFWRNQMIESVSENLLRSETEIKRRGRQRGFFEVIIIASTNMVYVVTEERLRTHKTGNMRVWHSTFERLKSYLRACAYHVTCIRLMVTVE